MKKLTLSMRDPNVPLSFRVGLLPPPEGERAQYIAVEATREKARVTLELSPTAVASLVNVLVRALKDVETNLKAKTGGLVDMSGRPIGARDSAPLDRPVLGPVRVPARP